MADALSEQLIKELLRRGASLDELGIEASTSLWPREYSDLTGECAYRFLTEHVYTLEETSLRPTAIPAKEYLRKFCDVWVECKRTGTPLHVIKSRRLVISWAATALEVWCAGIQPMRVFIAAENYESANGSCGFVYRAEYIYNEICARNPDWELGPGHGVGGGGPGQRGTFTMPNGAQFTAINSQAGTLQGSGAGVLRLEELSQYSNVEHIVAQAVINVQGPPDTVGGFVVSISNATSNPEYLDLIKPYFGTKLLTHGECEVRESANGAKVLAIHYASDPEKGGEWSNKARRNIPDRQWLREMEGDITTYDGEPVYPMFQREFHVMPEPFEWPRARDGGQFVAGWDAGNTLMPAFVLGYVTFDEQVQILMEHFSEKPISIEQFCESLARELDRKCNYWRSLPIHHVVDPAAKARSATHRHMASALDIMRDHGFYARLATNNLAARLSAVSSALSDTLYIETPAGEVEQASRVLIDPSCKMLIDGLSGGYRYEDNGKAGGDVNYGHPKKNAFSHTQDALQYLMLEAQKIIKHGTSSQSTSAQRMRIRELDRDIAPRGASVFSRRYPRQ